MNNSFKNLEKNDRRLTWQQNVSFAFADLFKRYQTKLTVQAKILLNSIYFIVGLIVWINIFWAQFLIYDDNYGVLLSAFLFSVVLFIGFFILWAKRKYLWQSNRTATIVFILTCSPITVGLLLIYYESFFGHLDK